MSQENQIKHMIRLGEPSLLGEPSYAGSCPRASSVITVSANCAPWFSSLGCCVCVGGDARMVVLGLSHMTLQGRVGNRDHEPKWCRDFEGKIS